MTGGKGIIPEDNYNVGDAELLSPEQIADSKLAHAQLKEKVASTEVGLQAYNATLRVIEERHALAKLRKAHHLTQATVGGLLNMSQSEVSKLERRSDMLTSTIRSYIEAMGGQLAVRAIIGGVEIPLEGFSSAALELKGASPLEFLHSWADSAWADVNDSGAIVGFRAEPDARPSSWLLQWSEVSTTVGTIPGFYSAASSSTEHVSTATHSQHESENKEHLVA